MNAPQQAARSSRNTIMIVRICLAGLFALSLVAGPAAAHSGGTNAQGCHAGSQPYHCH
ncbi:MAG: hypothetical protein ACJAVR_002199 [Paracoccaceae bacterium]|jgi:hypothetical protein